MSNNLPTTCSEEKATVDDEETNAITMVDVLKEESELEEDANAVLGGSDAQNCTYPQGYVKRQALYACLTCIPVSDEVKRAGICLACSYSCHEGHELVELYTKRNFRCDCGNSLFGSKNCNLEPVKELNGKNVYNQNFCGVYCVCKRPYPDPDDPVADEMIQCIICEDWYHGRHLNASLPGPDNYSEMICESCMSKNDFLRRYAGAYSVRSESAGEDNVAASSNQLSDSVQPEESATKSASSVCLLPSSLTTTPCKGATFWPEGWRKYLCVCDDCKNIYQERGVEYLTDMQDTVHHYEEQGKEKTRNGSQYDQAMQALSQLDRMKQVEAIQGYNEMKNQLKDYLQKFAENGKIVREEDIREFFTQIAARKRQRVEIPTFCR